MKEDFYNVLKQSGRKVVIHHCHLIPDMVSLLKANDLLFFDDCLYSQYVFIKQNISLLRSLHINCVLGFSTELHRNATIEPIYAIKSAILHDRIHQDDISALNGFMSLDEITELLAYDNVYIACHGNMHLQLEKISVSNMDCICKFTNDLSAAVDALSKFNISTDIFVYPYTFDFFISDKIVQKYGFKYIFAGKNTQRIEIERLQYEKDIHKKTN